MNQLKINSENGRDAAVILFDRFNSKEGIFGHNIMPEDILPVWNSDLTSSGIKKGSYEHLMFITLVVSIDYQRDANRLWESGRKTFEDEETRWLFFPKEVVEKQHSQIKSAMMKHGLYKVGTNPRTGLGDVEIWSKVSKSFFDVYDSNPMNLIKQCKLNALKIFEKKFDLRFKQLFPYFSGDKIFPLWIRMLRDNVGLELTDIEKIPIPVDIHIARATFTTGCLQGKYSGTVSNKELMKQIDEGWRKSLSGINHEKLRYVLQLDESLWHLSKYGCRFRKGTRCKQKARCPVGHLCVDGTIKGSSKKLEVNTGGESNGERTLGDFML